MTERNTVTKRSRRPAVRQIDIRRVLRAVAESGVHGLCVKVLLDGTVLIEQAARSPQEAPLPFDSPAPDQAPAVDVGEEIVL